MRRAPGEDLGSLCWGIRLSQSKPFHIIGQGHLLSRRSGEAFPTNATQLARSSILCFATFLCSLKPQLSFFHCFFFSPSVLLLLSSLAPPPVYWLRIGEVPDRTPHTCAEIDLDPGRVLNSDGIAMRRHTGRGRHAKLEELGH